MKISPKVVGTILLTSVWISCSEFLRNQVLFSSYWIDHYHKMGLVFPSKAVNGMVWGIWSLSFATLIYVLAQKFSFWQTVALAWLSGFIMMWLVVGNMEVLPLSLLWFAVPLSLVEVIVATWLVSRFSNQLDHR